MINRSLLVGSVASGATGGAARPLDFSDVGKDPAGGGWDTWLVSLLHVLTVMRGASDRTMPLTGIAVPMLTGLDTMTVVALLTPHVVLACQRLTGQPGPLPHDQLNDDHKIDATNEYGRLASEAISTTTTWVQYLAATPDPSDSSIRGGNSPGAYTVIGGQVADPYDITNAISLVKYWQACIDQSALATHAIGASPAGTASPVPLDNAVAFMTAVQHMTTHMDLIKQDAASSTATVIQQSVSAAKDAFNGLADGAANLAGEIAAKAANKAGELAGGAAAGFFSQIGAIGYAVTAVVIYLAFYR